MLTGRILALFFAGLMVALPLFGCGADSSTTVSAVDDSVVHSPEKMEEMSKQNAQDMNSH